MENTCSVCLEEIHCCGEHKHCQKTPEIIIDDFETDEVIEYSKNQEKIKLCCGHTFHKGCIYEWLKEHNTCPLCRDKMLIVTEMLDKVERPKTYRFIKQKCKYFKINGEIIGNVYGQLINQNPMGYIDNRPIYGIIGKNDTYYVDYYLRQVILTCRIEYDCISEKTDFLGRKILFTNQEIEKDSFSKNHFDIAYNWIVEVLLVMKNTHNIVFLEEFNSLAMDLMVMIIKKFRLSRSLFQTAIIVAIQNMIFITHGKLVEREWLIDLTCRSSNSENFDKYNKFVEEYITKHVEDLK